MWNIAICDDEPEICAQINEALLRFSRGTGEILQNTFYSSAEQLLSELPKDTDILLLDIGMGGISGMEAARQLRGRGCDIPIIFITTMTQYAIDGYAVHAFGFLKKPLQYAQFHLVLLDALRALRRARGETIRLDLNRQSTILSSRDILFFEAYGHHVDVHLTDGRSLPCSSSLAELEARLSNIGFFRVHKSYLVNLEHIRKIDSAALSMGSEISVPLSKHRRKELRLAFAGYCGGKML